MTDSHEKLLAEAEALREQFESLQIALMESSNDLQRLLPWLNVDIIESQMEVIESRIDMLRNPQEWAKDNCWEMDEPFQHFFPEVCVQ